MDSSLAPGLIITLERAVRRLLRPAHAGATLMIGAAGDLTCTRSQLMAENAFLNNHSRAIWACDFLQLYDVLFRPLFAFFFVVYGTRDVVNFKVTRRPADVWAAQQLREATPLGNGPHYLIRDNDNKFQRKFDAVAKATGIEVIKIPPSSPNLNPICERFLGSVRRECLDHVVILSD